MEKYLSEVELYYSTNVDLEKEQIVLDEEEFKHIIKVMRHKEGDRIYVTDGLGKIYETQIEQIFKDSVDVKIKNVSEQPNEFKLITFCIPVLKNPDRLKFALEKSVELGITNFILFSSKHTIGKSKNIERLNKILISAMKQSLRANLPKIELMKLDEIIKLKGKKVVFGQKAEKKFKGDFDSKELSFFIFGPEGGFDKEELDNYDDCELFSLSSSRLRSETAVVTCASLLRYNS
jgi:16S rRNA (uracil1498-N3)-methyltransferase